MQLTRPDASCYDTPACSPPWECRRDEPEPMASDVHNRVREVLREVPPHVTVVAAAKGAPAYKVRDAIEAGIRVIGQNYFAEARRIRTQVPEAVAWHFLGRLRPHDIRPANLSLFDVLQSVDSCQLAERINSRGTAMNRCVPVLLEINSAREPQKGGLLLEEVEPVLREVSSLPHIRVIGLMTMGPLTQLPEECRPFFSEVRQLYEYLSGLDIPGVQIETLSMGMSDTYRVAIEEGATMVRLGTRLFGPRQD